MTHLDIIFGALVFLGEGMLVEDVLTGEGAKVTVFLLLGSPLPTDADD